MKTRQIILFVTLLALLVAVASATDVSTDTTGTSATVDVSSDAVGTGATPSVVEDTTPTTTGNLEESVTSKQTENNLIIKEEKNKKTAYFDVSSSDDLITAFDSTNEEVTVNIIADITLYINPSLNPDIKTLTIEGNGHTVNGSNTHRFLDIESRTTVNIKNLTITNCYYIGDGGAIYNNGGTLNITESNLTQNTAVGWGGAIYNNGGTLNITQSNLTQNTATGQDNECGGAIYNSNGGTLNITDSNLTHNTATGQGEYGYGYGGAIYNYYGGTVNIAESNLTHNTATGQNNDGRGGAIYNYYGGTVNIAESNLTHNNATGQNIGEGGAIYNSGTLTITDSNLTQNNATGQAYDGVGGAIYNTGTLNITESNLTQNTATGEYGGGGAIFNTGSGTVNIAESNLTQNTATGQNIGEGGAICNTGSGTVNITQSNLTHNTANRDGGAIYNTGTLNITESNLTQNTATMDGGAIYNTGSGTVNITQSNLTHNTATIEGGAIYNYYGAAEIHGNTFTNNLAKSPTSTENEGAIIDVGRDTIIRNNTNAGSLKYNSTIYTNNYFEVFGEIYPVSITFNTFDNQPRNTTITISTNNTTTPKVTDIINITLELKDDFNLPVTGENITVTINQNETTLKTDSSGIASMDYQVIGTETVVNATYSGKEGDYNATNTVLTLVAEKMETKLLVDDVSTLVGKAFTINGTLLDINDKPLVSALVNITVNGTKTNATTNAEGQFNTTMTLQEMGEYLVNVTFYENEVYEESNNNTALVTASKTDTQLTLNVSNSTPVNDTVITITVNLTDNTGEPLDNQEVDITIGEETFTINTTSGIASKECTVSQLGAQTITATYTGNNMYNANSTTTRINVIKLDTKLTLMVSNNTPVNNTSITITATLTDAADNKLAGQNITLNINDITQTIATNSNGTVTQTYTPTKTGKQTITAVYNGDSQYNNSTKQSIDINVIKIDSKLTVTVSNTTPINSTTINITVKLTDTNDNQLANQNITIKVSDKTFTVKTNADGTATQSYTPTTLGKQTITATYNGDSKHTNSTATTTITVKKINTKLDLKVSNTTPVNSTPVTITVTLTDENNQAVPNQNITLKVSDQTFTVKTNNNGVAIQNYTPTKVEKQTIVATYNGGSKYTNSTATTSITVKKINTLLELKVSNTTPVNNTPINIIVTLTDANNNKLSKQEVTLNINGKTITTNTNTNGTITQTYTPDKIGSQNITATYNGDSKYTNTTKTTSITVRNKYNTKTVTTSVTGTIGEKLTLTATVTDENNQKVTSGNLIFKINGVTIKDNGKLTGSNNPLKTKVTNGLATATITPDLNMVNSDKITASYIGTAIYNASTSTPASIKISKRNATIEITTNKKIVKQGQVLTITAKIYDTTGGKKSTNLAAYSDEFVYFKINGVTIKDENGQMLKVKVVNGVAKLNYTVPVGISCVLDTQSMTPKNHTIQVGFYNKNYQDIISNNPHFQVERSPITINIADATINNKTHKLSMKITIKDYLGNTVAGPNKLIIKVNGVTLKNGTQVMYYFTTDGVLDLKNTPVPQAKNYTTIEVITQDRLAYMSQRNMTSKVKVTN